MNSEGPFSALNDPPPSPSIHPCIHPTAFLIWAHGGAGTPIHIHYRPFKLASTSKPRVHFFGLWEEAGEEPHTHGGNMQAASDPQGTRTSILWPSTRRSSLGCFSSEDGSITVSLLEGTALK